MAEADTLPVDCDYGFGIGREGNILRGRVESGREYRRQKAPPRRIWNLTYLRRPRADWKSIEEFLRKVDGEHFTLTDKENDPPAGGRKHSVLLHSEPEVQTEGFEAYSFRFQVIEAVGVALATYPTFSGDFPFVNVPVAKAETIGADKQFVVASFGYRVNGSFTSTFLDEVSQGSTNPVTSVALGLHRVRVVGGSPTSLDFLI